MDNQITQLLQERQIVGLSLAVIRDGRIVHAQGYGLAEKSAGTPITADTLFQAGSLSKCLAALGALHLVEQAKLHLDGEVNSQLRTWKIPENEFTVTRKVLLRDILSHSSGLTVHGFPGHRVSEEVPTLVEVLEGTGRSHTPPVRVSFIPGTKSSYSGGGYTVLQQLIGDVTGSSFPEFMADSILKPLGLRSSTFAQPLPPERVPFAATGHDNQGKPIPGRWHVYPQMAAAGLWTTATDLARFVIGLQDALAGKPNPVISQAMAREMLTRQRDNLGLGMFLEGEGDQLGFYHGGRNRGFDALLMAYASKGSGIILLSNSNDETGAFKAIARIVAKAC